MKLRSLAFASLLLCTACPSDDDGDDDVATETETGTETSTDTDTDTGTETGPLCGVGAMVCCAELEECVTTEDCCDPATYTCALEGPTNKCLDLVQMCSDCLANCPAAPDVCEGSCAIWCNPP
jgi:hypothetical protein